MKILLLIFVLYLMHLDWCISEEIVFGQRIKRLKGSKDKKLKNSTDEIKDHESTNSFNYILPPNYFKQNLNLNDRNIYKNPQETAIRPPSPADHDQSHQSGQLQLAPSKSPLTLITSTEIQPQQTQLIQSKPYIYTPKHSYYNSDNLPVYKDDPKEHLKALIHSSDQTISRPENSIKIVPPPTNLALKQHHQLKQQQPLVDSPSNLINEGHIEPRTDYHELQHQQYQQPHEYQEQHQYEQPQYQEQQHQYQQPQYQEQHQYQQPQYQEQHQYQQPQYQQPQYQPPIQLQEQNNYHQEEYNYIPGIPGVPWKDYPVYTEIPHTSFSCSYTNYPGFYADVETGCQVWHYCQLDGRHDRFLCPKGTLFNQETRVCDWWYNVHCQSSPSKYNINSDLYGLYSVNVPHEYHHQPQHQVQHQVIYEGHHEPHQHQAHQPPYQPQYHDDGMISESITKPQKTKRKIRRRRIKIKKKANDLSLNYNGNHNSTKLIKSKNL